jgi:hypothetical protein
VSECVSSFWQKAINAKAQGLMKRYEECNKACSSSVESYQNCVARNGGEECSVKLRAAENCIGLVLKNEKRNVLDIVLFGFEKRNVEQSCLFWHVKISLLF